MSKNSRRRPQQKDRLPVWTHFSRKADRVIVSVTFLPNGGMDRWIDPAITGAQREEAAAALGDVYPDLSHEERYSRLFSD